MSAVGKCRVGEMSREEKSCGDMSSRGNVCGETSHEEMSAVKCRDTQYLYHYHCINESC